MDIKMYQSFTSQSTVGKQIILSHESPDLLGAVLRLHLCIENALDGWICATVHNENAVDDIRASFYTKLLLAKNLGLPHDIFELIVRINKIRNDFSHKIEINIISDDKIKNLEQLSNKINHHADSTPLEDISVVTKKETINYKSADIKTKFIMICMRALIQMTYCCLNTSGQKYSVDVNDSRSK